MVSNGSILNYDHSSQNSETFNSPNVAKGLQFQFTSNEQLQGQNIDDEKVIEDTYSSEYESSQDEYGKQGDLKAYERTILAQIKDT